MIFLSGLFSKMITATCSQVVGGVPVPEHGAPDATVVLLDDDEELLLEDDEVLLLEDDEELLERRSC